MTPYTANAIAEILHKAGFLAGLFQVVHGDFQLVMHYVSILISLKYH